MTPVHEFEERSAGNVYPPSKETGALPQCACTASMFAGEGGAAASGETSSGRMSNHYTALPPPLALAVHRTLRLLLVSLNWRHYRLLLRFWQFAMKPSYCSRFGFTCGFLSSLPCFANCRAKFLCTEATLFQRVTLIPSLFMRQAQSSALNRPRRAAAVLPLAHPCAPDIITTPRQGERPLPSGLSY
jgi:hypothetical protein